MSDERCFCGAKWNDVAEECTAGHSFGDEDRLRVENGKLRAALLEFCAMCCLTPRSKEYHCARGPDGCAICAAWPLLAPSEERK